MRIDRERADGPVVTGFSGGGFKVAGGGSVGTFASVLLTPVSALPWDAPPLAALTAGALAALLALAPPPEFVLVGTGPTLLRPPPALVTALEAAGSGIEAMDSRAAARAWAVLRGEGRWIAAALYPL